MRSFALRSPGFNLVVKWIGFVIQYCTHYQLRPKKNRPLRFGSPSLSLSFSLAPSIPLSLSLSPPRSRSLPLSLSLCLSLSLSSFSFDYLFSLLFHIYDVFCCPLCPSLPIFLSRSPSVFLALSLSHTLSAFLSLGLSLSLTLFPSLSLLSLCLCVTLRSGRGVAGIEALVS